MAVNPLFWHNRGDDLLFDVLLKLVVNCAVCHLNSRYMRVEEMLDLWDENLLVDRRHS